MTSVRVDISSPEGNVEVTLHGRVSNLHPDYNRSQIATLLDDAVDKIRAAYGITEEESA